MPNMSPLRGLGFFHGWLLQRCRAYGADADRINRDGRAHRKAAAGRAVLSATNAKRIKLETLQQRATL